MVITVDKRHQLLASYGTNMRAKVTLNARQNVSVITRVGGTGKQNNYTLAVLVVKIIQILPLVDISHERARFAIFRLRVRQKDESIVAMTIEKRPMHQAMFLQSMQPIKDEDMDQGAVVKSLLTHYCS